MQLRNIISLISATLKRILEPHKTSHKIYIAIRHNRHPKKGYILINNIISYELYQLPINKAIQGYLRALQGDTYIVTYVKNC